MLCTKGLFLAVLRRSSMGTRDQTKVNQMQDINALPAALFLSISLSIWTRMCREDWVTENISAFGSTAEEMGGEHKLEPPAQHPHLSPWLAGSASFTIKASFCRWLSPWVWRLWPYPESQGKQDRARSAFELKAQKMKDKGRSHMAQLTEQNAPVPMPGVERSLRLFKWRASQCPVTQPQLCCAHHAYPPLSGSSCWNPHLQFCHPFPQVLLPHSHCPNGYCHLAVTSPWVTTAFLANCLLGLQLSFQVFCCNTPSLTHTYTHTFMCSPLCSLYLTYTQLSRL